MEPFAVVYIANSDALSWFEEFQGFGGNALKVLKLFFMMKNHFNRTVQEILQIIKFVKLMFKCCL